MKRAISISISFILLVLFFAYLDLVPNLNLDSFSKLYGLDYLTIFLIIIGQYLLKDKNKYAFVFYILGNIVNIGLGYIIESPPVIAFSFLGILIMGNNYKQWKNEESKKSLQKK